MNDKGGDLVQDVASKGLGLVFECCSTEQQDQLAAELVGSLTTDRRPAMQVTKDTKVFEEGTMGANPSGYYSTSIHVFFCFFCFFFSFEWMLCYVDHSAMICN